MSNNILIYDSETKRVPYTGGYKKPGIEYADGWRDYKGLSVSCIGVWSSWAGYEIFPECNLYEFQHLADEADHVIGFNSSRFDDLLLEAIGIRVKTTYDLLLEAWRAAGLNPDYTFPASDPPEVRAKYAGFRLEDLARANLPYGKSSSGDKAPELWQRGEFRKVLDYCLGDVEIPRRLLEYGWQGKLWHAGTRQFLRLRPLEKTNYRGNSSAN